MKQMMKNMPKNDGDGFSHSKGKDGPMKRHILESVHSDKFPRPEFQSGWAVYNHADAPPPAAFSPQLSPKLAPKPQQAMSQSSGQSNPSTPQIQNLSMQPSHLTEETKAQSLLPVVPQSTQQPLGDISGVITYFISRLPSSQVYNGLFYILFLPVPSAQS
jgi:hypothetical protein